MTNRFLRLVSLATLAFSPSLALAGAGGTDCASARVLSSNSTYSGDTSAPGYGNPIGGMGPLPSPANDAIYTFTAVAGITGRIMVVAANYNFGIFLTTNCAGTTAAPLQAATGPTVPASFPLDGLLAEGTQYWIIVSANPSDSSAPSGSLTFQLPYVPVELQSFSIE